MEIVSQVDYKRGAPRKGDEGIDVWDADRMQLAVQAIVLRENGYRCDEGIIYYVATRQRVRVPLTDELIAHVTATSKQARALAASRQIATPDRQSQMSTLFLGRYLPAGRNPPEHGNRGC